MDKLIGSFVQSIIDILNEVQLKNLEKFLDIDDDTLYKIYNNQNIEVNLCNEEILDLFKKFNYKK
jgi:succinate dehydrogenase flavin-adding protein (antitoxin of CptAB toxin-antitoxin module)